MTWISERKDVLCALFYGMALLGWARGDRWLPFAFGALLLALFSKAMAISIPLVWLLHELVLVRRVRPARLAVAAVGILMSILFSWLNKAAQTEAINESAPLGIRIGIAATAPLFYTVKTLVPMDLSPFYPMEMRPSRHLVGAMAGGVFCLAGLLVVVWAWRRRPVVAFALLSSAVCLGPVSGLLSFGSAFAADRYSYIPTVLLLPALVALPIDRLRPIRMLAAIAALVLLSALSTLTIRQQSWWSSSENLWARVLEVYPTSRTAVLNQEHARVRPSGGAAQVLEKVGVLSEAASPDVRDDVGTAALLLLGNRLRRERQFTEAREVARRVAKKDQSYHLLRLIAEDSGNTADALEMARRVLDHEVHASPSFRAQAALTLIDQGHDEEALTALASIHTPTEAGHQALGVLAFRAREKGRIDEAINLAQRALAIHPASYNAVFVAGEELTAEEAEERLSAAVRHSLATDETRHYAWRRLATLRKDSSLLERAYAVDFSTVEDPARRAKSLAYTAAMAEQDRRLVDAERLYGLGLQSDSDNTDALMGLAIIRIIQKRPERAIALMERAARLAPEDTSITANLERLRQSISSK